MNEHMKLALKEAKKAYEKEEVPVGAIIVKDNKIIAKAYNTREKTNCAISHAEILCIQKACKKMQSWRLDGCEMYVTLEPCLMCAGAIAQSRIDKVFFGAKDPKNGCVCSVLQIEKIPITNKVVYEYLETNECSEILSHFFRNLRKNKKES